MESPLWHPRATKDYRLWITCEITSRFPIGLPLGISDPGGQVVAVKLRMGSWGSWESGLKPTMNHRHGVENVEAQKC